MDVKIWTPHNMPREFYSFVFLTAVDKNNFLFSLKIVIMSILLSKMAGFQ